jgi:hypothetical protein
LNTLNARPSSALLLANLEIFVANSDTPITEIDLAAKRKIFTNIFNWIHLRNTERVLWLCGGELSSSIAIAVTKSLQIHSQILAGNFCEDCRGTRWTTHQLVLATAVQCAEQLCEAREIFELAFDRVDMDDHSACHYENLVVEPLNQLTEILLPRLQRTMVILFHTLSDTVSEELVEFLGTKATLFPSWVRILVVSKSEYGGVPQEILSIHSTGHVRRDIQVSFTPIDQFNKVGTSYLRTHGKFFT